MKEQLISFETAKLAKEKGFTEPCENWYNFSRLLLENCPQKTYPSNDRKFPSYSAPTQSLLQKWLREKHGIHVTVYFCSKNEYDVSVGKSKYPCMHHDLIYEPKRFYSTYEQALEIGLKTALELIENNSQPE